MISAANVFASAFLMWHMGAAGGNAVHPSLNVHGGVEMGAALDGSERKASLARGGDGAVARFKGGWLTLDQGLDFSGAKKMTFLIRMRDPLGRWDTPILARNGEHSALGTFLYGTDGRLEYTWRTTPLRERVAPDFDIEGFSQDARDGVLRIGVPAKLIDPTAWHDVLVRFNEAHLEMFVDGVLVDEEWPHGGLCDFRAPLVIGAGYVNGGLKGGFTGEIDHLAFWDRALGDDEIAAISGGRKEVARRDIEIFGPVRSSLQYWSPRGYNTNAGDCMPFYHDGTFHLFYLFDRRHHGSKWGMGAHQYAHVSSTDLVHWQHHPLAIPISRQWECSMGTGDIIWNDGVYNIFYTDCGSRCEFSDKPERSHWIYRATSTDGVHFKKDYKPILRGHDCKVSRDPVSGQFQLLRFGTNLVASTDLQTWHEEPGSFVQLKKGTSEECPNLWEWNGWFYFMIGRNAIWKSRRPKGPWEEMAPTVYDGLFVPKVAAFRNNRRILAGFLGDNGWAGCLVLRELVQMPGGQLGVKWLKEQVPAVGEPVGTAFTSMHAGAAGDGKVVKVNAPDGLGLGALSGIPQDVLITMKVVPGQGAGAYGLCVRGSGDYQDGCELRFEPGKRCAQWGEPVRNGLADVPTEEIWRGGNYVMNQLDCLDRPFELKIIVKRNLVDAEIDGRRTMITRRNPEPPGDRLFFFARNGSVAFEDISIRPLLEDR